jgi:hypothetical protein
MNLSVNFAHLIITYFSIHWFLPGSWRYSDHASMALVLDFFSVIAHTYSAGGFKRVFIITVCKSMSEMINSHPTCKKLQYSGFKMLLPIGKMWNEVRILSQRT